MSKPNALKTSFTKSTFLWCRRGAPCVRPRLSAEMRIAVQAFSVLNFISNYWYNSSLMNTAKIESYSFGKMVIDGKTFTSDLILYPDRIHASWRREEGHLLQIQDLTDILDAYPAWLIIGTGAMGVMKVPPELREQLENKGIQLHVARTGKAVKFFNNLDTLHPVIAAFHLTC